MAAPSASPLKIEIRQSETSTVLSLVGELDLFNLQQFRKELARIEPTRPEALVIDLRGLTHLDSSGLGAILGAHQRARIDGRRLAIVITGSLAVERLFQTIRADSYFDLIDAPDAL